MKKIFLISVLIFSLYFCTSSYGEIFEASGKGKIPAISKTPAQAKILARRGAILDLQRNLLLKTRSGYSHSGNVYGIIKGIVITNENWDGKIYTVTGYIKR